MNQRNSNLTPVKDILGALLNDSRLPFNPDDAQIWHTWAEAVGPAIARNASPLWIKKGKLRVKVSDPIWLQELSLVGESIKEKLNEKLGRRAVERIEFRLRSR
jgi:predicted nucleic acid-binding Zn ribbon protein